MTSRVIPDPGHKGPIFFFPYNRKLLGQECIAATPIKEKMHKPSDQETTVGM